MKKNQLTNEEKQIIRDYNAGEYKIVKNFDEEKRRHMDYAKATLEKNKTINIRISEKDLLKLKSLAIKEGMPYQTLIHSLLHKHINQNI